MTSFRVGGFVAEGCSSGCKPFLCFLDVVVVPYGLRERGVSRSDWKGVVGNGGFRCLDNCGAEGVDSRDDGDGGVT